ncbi:MAG: hypothetical protein HC866_08515 [Leptolyngbyaceae cyanobacterium RU_5_1]|nr:hypothetical protein [Leptolyngbyaceae cyanobacterium RU_5_1]
MTQNVAQWLSEIKALKQQLAEVHQEREQAYSSATNWQHLYETEAQQRRVEATLARQTIETLQQEVQHLKGNLLSGESVDVRKIQAELEPLKTEAEIRSRLIRALAECDRLNRALQTEQSNHAQTRKSLTTALGDAIDMLSKGKGEE